DGGDPLVPSPHAKRLGVGGGAAVAVSLLHSFPAAAVAGGEAANPGPVRNRIGCDVHATGGCVLVDRSGVLSESPDHPLAGSHRYDWYRRTVDINVCAAVASEAVVGASGSQCI